MSALLQAALDYAELGYAVFPVKPGAKAPPLLKRGCLDASTDADQIKQWWARWRRANVAIATGSISGGLLVIDVDPDRGGLESLARLVAELGDMPETPTVETPSGGLHIYYHLPAGVLGRNTVDEIAPGIDTRGEGGYVLAPPSIVADSTYRELS